MGPPGPHLNLGPFGQWCTCQNWNFSLVKFSKLLGHVIWVNLWDPNGPPCSLPKFGVIWPNLKKKIKNSNLLIFVSVWSQVGGLLDHRINHCVTAGCRESPVFWSIDYRYSRYLLLFESLKSRDEAERPQHRGKWSTWLMMIKK